MHIVGNLVALSFTSFSKLFTVIRWPTLTTVVPMRTTTTTMPTSDVANHATNYGQHAACSRASASATTPGSRQAWIVSEDQTPNILSLHQTNGRR
jgi:hypothetical protein